MIWRGCERRGRARGPAVVVLGLSLACAFGAYAAPVEIRSGPRVWRMDPSTLKLETGFTLRVMGWVAVTSPLEEVKVTVTVFSSKASASSGAVM